MRGLRMTVLQVAAQTLFEQKNNYKISLDLIENKFYLHERKGSEVKLYFKLEGVQYKILGIL